MIFLSLNLITHYFVIVNVFSEEMAQIPQIHSRKGANIVEHSLLKKIKD